MALHAVPSPSTQPDHDKMMQFAFKVVGDLSAMMSGPLLYIGDRLGLFKALAETGPITVDDFAAKTGLNHRYLREWASSMVTAQYLDYDPQTGEISLSTENAKVLADEDSPVFIGGLAQMIPDHYRVMPRIMQCFKEGGGVPYSEYSEDTFIGTERLFRTGYLNFLTTQWIPAMPEVHAKLQRGARVADVGCGRGQALLNMARAFPQSTFIGLDCYAPGIEYANNVAQENNLKNLSFQTCAANTLPQSPKFDLVMTCDSLHDMVSPEAAARSIFSALTPDGAWFCIEPNVRDRLEENINPLGRLFFSVSTLQCMSCSLAHNGAGYGAGMGQGNIERVARLAGFTRFRRLPIENPFNQFFEIRK